VKASHVHMRHLWPLPHGLLEIFKGFKRVIVPELNSGQLIKVLQVEYPEIKFEPHNKMMGKPFQARELKAHFESVLEETS